MKKTGVFTRILVIAGTLLAWFPLLAPLLLGVGVSIARRRFMIDYLMPAELFPVALVGGLLLLWAAIRMKSRRGLIGGGLGAAVVLLFGSQGLAVLTGLASGEAEPVGWRFALVLGMLAGYIVALAVVGVGGALLLREVFGKK